jgi:hypothetical protein
MCVPERVVRLGDGMSIDLSGFAYPTRTCKGRRKARRRYDRELAQATRFNNEHFAMRPKCKREGESKESPHEPGGFCVAPIQPICQLEVPKRMIRR